MQPISDRQDSRARDWPVIERADQTLDRLDAQIARAGVRAQLARSFRARVAGAPDAAATLDVAEALYGSRSTVSRHLAEELLRRGTPAR